MRLIFPEAGPVEPATLYAAPERTPAGQRPWVLCNMIESLDGATAIADKTATLGNAADRELLTVIRGVADVVLVAAGTVRAEGYGPVRLPEAVQRARVERGQTAVPRMAIATASLNLDLGAPLFTESDPPPVVITTPEADLARRTEIATTADLLLAGHAGSVEVSEAIGALGEMGASVVLCEGGPSLNGQLLEADLLDELCLSLSPTLGGGDSKRMISGASEGVRAMRLTWAIEDNSYLFLRYERNDQPDAV